MSPQDFLTDLSFDFLSVNPAESRYEMKSLFYSAALLLIFFEVANVFFIMPMPGSQKMESIGIAYFLYSKRWIIRSILILIALVGVIRAWKNTKWLVIFLLLAYAGVLYLTHFKMAADTMFYQPRHLHFLKADSNVVSPDRLIIGVTHNGEAKAYPIQYLGYHHQVQDTIGGKPVMVTYCTVCRTGRVFEPKVNGQFEKFRLVGMDHYNAMFEDHTTKSWWRQATGEAIAGPLAGNKLPEVPSIQSSLETWLDLYPGSLIMQADSNFSEIYDGLSDYESGQRLGRLTRRDTASWQDKSWIAGIDLGEVSKAYDWNELISKGVINDSLASTPVSIVVARDQKSLFAFRRHSNEQLLSFRNDTLTDGRIDYILSGIAMDTAAKALRIIPVYQEYWHSWRTFHPNTLQ